MKTDHHPGLRSLLALLLVLSLASACAGAPARTISPPCGATAAHAASSEPATIASATGPLSGTTLPSSSPCQAATGPSNRTRTAGKIEVVWRVDPFVSLFWAIDQASSWDEETASTYAEFFQRELPKANEDADLLRAYARVRRAYSSSSAGAESEPDPAYPTDMLPPRLTPAERYAHAFLCAGSIDVVATRLAMAPDDQKTLARTFAHFRPRLEAELHRAAFLERALGAMKTDAEQARMSEFLFAMARFYGTVDALPSPLYVDLVWGPPDSHQATAIDDHMMIQISEKIASDPKALAGWLGVTVHEFGHQFLAYMPEEQRRRTSNRIVAKGGLLRRRHANVIDEATQAALGNLLFMRERLPFALDERMVYSFEPTLDYPEIIDTLSRRAEPLVREALAKGEMFDGRYLDALLAAQASAVAPRLDHFSHVALLFVGSNDARRFVDGLFWGRSRFASSDLEDFAKTSMRAESMSRWVVLTLDELAAHRDGLRKTMPDAERLERDLGKNGGCVRASARASSAWDVTVLGRDLDGLRRILIAVRRGLAPRDAHPFCVL